MYIEDICLEGFKSYATKTVVPNFDEQFNAITGLNGSGKSNILDSICFVLGITNLSHVRAGNLQELVYKQGQAGVTKATVSITFNNSNPEKSPAGYEHCEKLVVTRQIVIGGRNKYLINGHTAQPGRVQDLFHSVQLNVNNPHFLIMQGRVTKVLNMKPPEILAMLEEAAGTRMYETKRTSALKTLDKKQTKVEEINTVLEEEILPALEKLRKERGMYMQWVSANDQLDKLRRFCIAYDFTSAEESQDNSKADQTKLQDRIATLTDYCAQLDTSTDEINTKIEELTLERESQMGGELKSLADEADKLSKNLVKETSGWTNKKDSLKSEQDGVKKLHKTMVEIEEAAAKKAADLERISKDNGDLQSQWDAAVKNSADAEQELANVQAGGSGTNEDGKSKSFAEQVSDAKSAASSAESEAKQMDLKMKHMEKELAAKSKLLPTKQKEFEKLEKDLASHQSAVSTAQEQLGQLGYDEARAEELKETCAREQDAVRACREEVDKLSSQLSRVRFDYKDPERGFDRSKVKGVVAKLLRVKEPETATALEVLAGGKLYQVVVDTDATSKALLTRGQLSSRVTIIPLNRIKARTASSQQLSSANRLVGNDAALALSLVGYEEEVQSAMAYVFGMGFVCKDDEAAKKVAFTKDIMMNCVTLAGDLFNPSGTLTGGSRSSGASVLTALSHLLEAEGRLDAHHKALEAALHELRSVQTSEKEFLRLRREVEVKSHALTLLEERIKLSEAHQLAETVNHLKAEVEACMQSGQGARERREELVAHAQALEAEMKDFAATRGARLKAAEGAVKAAKAALSAARDAFKGMEAEMRDLTAERAALLEDRKELEEQVQSAEATVLALEEEVHTKGGKVAECRAAYEAAAAMLEERRARAQACDSEITTLGKDKAKLAKKQTDASVESKKAEHKLARLEKEAAEATQRVAKLLNEYPWIQSERHLFGTEGSAYDWAARDPQEAFTQLKEITETHEKMAKKVNKKVLSMFDKAEGEYKELVDKKAIVLKDKSKIQQVISELDEKKALALKATWEKVNKDFGSIFSTLLPGTMAKLEPPEGGSVLDGLEVKVAFGSVWKQSLTELSGGQRSLLALSLILSLLMFKPAPIYILDEVDAALDLSHTQNIGRMIKTHFPQSQFVVVSLKEGMFSNANVIYRTKFIDGVSTVTRTVPALTENDHNSRRNNASAKAVAAAADKTKKRRTNQENQAPVH